MGIDIYAKWKGQTKEEEEAQYTGFDATAGHVGYLREAYHGEPYATHFFVAEAFNEDTKIPASLLRERLPKTLELVAERYKDRTKELIKEFQKSYIDFVELCEKKEKETGDHCEIIASY